MTASNRPNPQHTPLPPRSRSATRTTALVVLLILVAAAAWWFWQRPFTESGSPTVAESTATGNADATVARPEPAPDEQAPSGPAHPVASTDASALPADAASQLQQAAIDLVGGAAAQALLRLDGVAHRVVATVDNLPRSHAPARTWPVEPTAGRFQIRQDPNAGMVVANENSARYSAFVSLVESIDLARLVSIYVRFHPLFQRSYEDLGFPGQHFNDRLVAVIDHLLQAPEPPPPVAITLVEIKSATPSPRPWVRYEFADPKLEALSAGQKLMIRVGLDNERRLKARLRTLRGLVADGALNTKR